MAGRRRQRHTDETLVARRTARAAALMQKLTESAGNPGQQVGVAAGYLRGAIARTTRDVPAEATAAAREAVRVLTALADQLFDAATDKRRSRS
jgi:hypothetical protein